MVSILHIHTMLKKFFTHPVLKKCYYAFLTLFGLLYCYHIVRFYILKVDCYFILEDFNQSIEIILFYSGLITVTLVIIQIISQILLKNPILIILNALMLISILALLWLFFNNTFLECFLHDLNLEGLFLTQ